MSVFLRVFKHLLPRGRAWSITADKPLRRFFEGLTGLAADVRLFVDLMWLDVRPQDTRELATWGAQFALVNPSRESLAAAWSATGGQDPAYIQATLRAAGFDVFVHDWWEPGTRPAVGVQAQATARNPLLYLRATTDTRALKVECGEALAACGEAWADAGNRLNPIGYPLVNRASESRRLDYMAFAGPYSYMGEPLASMDSHTAHHDFTVDYEVPNDPTVWPYFLYIGGAEFGTMAKVPQVRQNELEGLLLKMTPAHLWVGVLVEFI